MSALRVAHPGQPTRLVDLGPSTGRITHTRGAITGGAIVEAVKTVSHNAKRDARLRAERAAKP